MRGRLGALYGSFIRTERSPGYLLILADEERQRALDRLPVEARALGAALAYCALRPNAKWREYLFDWQPALVAGFDLGVFDATGQSCAVVVRLINQEVSVDDIHARLRWATTYIDDEHWTAKQERDLGLGHVRLTKHTVSPRFGITLHVSGDGASLDDSRLLSLVRQALAYRKPDGAIIELEPETRLSVKLGDPVWARVGAETLCTASNVGLDDLADFERRGVSFARLLHAADQLAS